MNIIVYYALTSYIVVVWHKMIILVQENNLGFWGLDRIEQPNDSKEKRKPVIGIAI